MMGMLHSPLPQQKPEHGPRETATALIAFL